MNPTKSFASATTEPNMIVAGWFEEYYRPLFRFLLRLTGDDQQAADILQDTFLRALDALARQDPPAEPRAWLYRIAANLAYNALKRQNRWRWLPFRGDEQTAGHESSIATAYAVRRCLAQLHAREAEALLLYELVGLSCIEIATINGERSETVRVRVGRARARFCELFSKEVGDDMC